MKKLFILCLFFNLLLSMDEPPTEPEPLVKVAFATSTAYFNREDLSQLRALNPLLDRLEDALNLEDVDPCSFATLMSLVGLSLNDLNKQMRLNPCAVERAIDDAVHFDYDAVLNLLIRYYAEGKGNKRGSRISPSHGGPMFVKAVQIYQELTKLKSSFGLTEPLEGSHTLTELNLFHQGIKELPLIPYSDQLTALDLQWNSQLMLNSKPFASYAKLTLLNLSCCSIKKLPQDVFSGLVALRELYLDSNPLKRLRSQHGTDLSALTMLSIKGCKNMCFLPQKFLNHETLETIITEDSGIRFLDGTNLPSIELKDFDKKKQQFFVTSG